MNRRKFTKNLGLTTGAILGAPSILSSSQLSTKKQPNLLYVFPDQMRLHAMNFWRTKGFKGALSTACDPVVTPSLDKFAKESLVLTQATSTHPVCSPHRGMLMSGMFPSKNGIEGYNCRTGRNKALHSDITCFTDVLLQSGYETAYVGKTHWHKTEALFDENKNYVGSLEHPGGYFANSFDTYIPPGKSRHGNKFWFQFINNTHNDAYAYSSLPKYVNGKKDGDMHRPKKFSAKYETKVIQDFIRNKHGERDANKPFSMVWAPNPPHSPYSKIEDVEENVYGKYYEEKESDVLLNRKNAHAPYPKTYSPKTKYAKSKKDRSYNDAQYYFSHITSIDYYFGEIMKTLEEAGEVENTIVVFTSDHGEMMGSHSLMSKNYIYDESFLVPFMVRFPKLLDHRLDDILLGTTDIMPTLLSLMGLKNNIPSTVQGNDYSDIFIKGDQSKQQKPESALYLNPKRKGLRTDKYTYQVNIDGKIEIYDLIKDPYQMNSLSLETIPTDDLAHLKRELGTWLKKSEDKWFQKKVNAHLIDYPV